MLTWTSVQCGGIRTLIVYPLDNVDFTLDQKMSVPPESRISTNPVWPGGTNRPYSRPSPAQRQKSEIRPSNRTPSDDAHPQP